MQKTDLSFWNNQLSLDERLRDLMNKLTLEEKVSLLSTSQSAIPRLGIEEYHVGGEAAHGVVDRSGGKSTVFPQPIGLSSTWNRQLMRKIGDVIGNEARIFYELNDRKTGLTLWAPTIDMERDPRWGRTEEAYGEDPYLTGQLSTELIKGMQGDDDFYIKLVAAPKHFYGNNNEYGREYLSNSIDPRNKREYYLKAFEPAFREGKALSMMTAYNGVNGVPAMQMNELKQVVRDEWQMDGFIVSDGGALTLNVEQYHYYDTFAEALADALKKGIDCFVDQKQLVEQAAMEALEKGFIIEEDINIAIRNMLRVRFRLGHFDLDPSNNPYDQVDTSKLCAEEHAEVALQATKESIVLLKNDKQTLPLYEQKTKKVAVIGPTANVTFKDWYTGYSNYKSTPLDGLKKRLPNAEIQYVSGNDEIALKSLQENKYVTISNDNHVKVTSAVKGQKETFELEEWGWNSQLLKSMANQKYISQQEDLDTFHANKEEAFGWFVKEKIAFQPLNINEQVYHLTTWEGKPLAISPDKELVAANQPGLFEKQVISSGIEKAVALAKDSDVAIVCVGNNPMLNGRETEDRPDIILPERQQQLIKAVYEANPNTIVVVIGSYPFAINWENETIPAVLYSAHGSQMLGDGIAQVLYGDEAPSGKLSMTWYKDVTHLPSIFDYDIIKGKRTYMYFDKPVLYPFGYGLSYTDFDYSSLKLSSTVLKEGEQIHLQVDLRNIGNMVGKEVVQVYASVKGSRVDRPRKQLIHFQKVELRPKETKTIHFTIDAKQLSFWDVNKEAYHFEQATCLLSIGSSSADIRLTEEIEMEGKVLPPRSLHALTKAENYDDYDQVFIDKGNDGLNGVTNLTDGWICFKDVVLPEEGSFWIEATTEAMPAKLVIQLDQMSSGPVAEIEINRDHPNQWKKYELPYKATKQVHDVYLSFEGPVSITSIQIKDKVGQ